jgi:hypothetical protein
MPGEGDRLAARFGALEIRSSIPDSHRFTNIRAPTRECHRRHEAVNEVTAMGQTAHVPWDLPVRGFIRILRSSLS